METLDAEELKSKPERTPSQTDRDGEPLADLGVLLVHGIGQSHSSDTLSRFGEPLVRWIVEWVGEFETAEVKVVDALLGVEAENPEVPAHARLRLSAPAADGSGNKSAQWLIAESWWAESFQVPSFGDIATWAIKVVPWTAFYHFNRRFNRALVRLTNASAEKPRRWQTLLPSTMAIGLEFIAVIAALLIAPVVVVALLVLLLLGLIPIPQLRRFVAAAQRVLASTIGDSYALLGPEISSAGIYGRVARQLVWLEKRSKKIAVVAHSQGAAIAYRIVSTRASDKCGLLVTFGAGIRKLVQIRLLDRIRGGWGWAPPLAGISFVLATLISRETLGLWQGLLLAAIIPLTWFVAGFIAGLPVAVVRNLLRKLPFKSAQISDKLKQLIGLGVIVGTVAAIVAWYPGEHAVSVSLLLSLAWGWILFANQRAGEDANNLRFKEATGSGRPRPATEQALPPQVRWIDFHAASDPVPNGPIFDGQHEDRVELRAEADGMESIPVHNRDSVLFDHTTYWQNAEDFVAEVAGALGQLSGLELSNVIPLDHERRIVARHRRRWRVRWLCRARWLVALMAGVVWIWSDLDSATEWLLGQLIALATSLPWLDKLLVSVLTTETTETTATQLLVLTAGTAVAYGAVLAAWLRWESRDRAALVSRRGFPTAKQKQYHSLLFHFAWVLVVTTGMLLACGWTQWAWWIYLLTIVVEIFVAAGISGGADTFGYPGDVAYTWSRLLTDLDKWNDEIKDEWLTKLDQSTIALIEPAVTQDGEPTWQASIDLVPPSSRHKRTAHYDQMQTPSLYDAAKWSTQAKTTVATLGDQKYVPVREILISDEDTGRAWPFWSAVIERPGFSDAQVAEALFVRAVLAQLRGDTQQSLLDNTRLIELENAPAKYLALGYLNRAGIFEENGQTDDALADYTAVIEFADAPAGNRASAYLYRGLLYQNLDQHDAAITDFSAIIDAADTPSDSVVQAYGSRGWNYYLCDNLDGLVNDSKQALALAPDKAWIGFNLALGKLLRGAQDEADALYGVHCKTASTAEIEAAIKDLEEAMEKYSGIDGLERNLQRLKARLIEVSITE